ncbi:MAG: hypothetical protein ABIL69_07310 [candidate division WOR-3 bacterium]
MNIVLLSIFTASVFSIEGLGQEQGIFRTPFYGDLNIAQIEFSLRPEFNMLNKGSDFRGIFWTNPFSLNMKIPVYKGLVFCFGSKERYNQSFDIYSKVDKLDMYVQGRGGIEEIYLQLNHRVNFAEIFFSGSYLYGSSREIWNYTIGSYSISDTFSYRNNGRVFSAGLKLFILSCYYEGLGRLSMEKSQNDTTYNLPQVLGLGIEHTLKDWNGALLFEYLFGEGINTVYRFKIIGGKDNLVLSYSYNPWYLSGIKEHSVGLIYKFGFKNFGKISIKPDISIRIKGELREFVFIPEFRLTLEEVFARRKK